MWIKINQFFIKELIKKYLVVFVEPTEKRNIYTRHFILIHLLLSHIKVRTSDFIIYIMTLINPNFSEKVFKLIGVYLIDFLFYKFPNYLIITYFLYEMCFNNFVLSPLFNKTLFVFAIYTIYKRFSNFIYNTESSIDFMVYNMYYKEKSIKYVNI